MAPITADQVRELGTRFYENNANHEAIENLIDFQRQTCDHLIAMFLRVLSQIVGGAFGRPPSLMVMTML